MRAARQTHEPIWEVEKIKEYFNKELPSEIVLDKSTTIINVRKFVDRHIGYIEANNGNPMYKRYYIRLKKLKQIIEGNRVIARDEHSTQFQNKLL